MVISDETGSVHRLGSGSAWSLQPRRSSPTDSFSAPGPQASTRPRVLSRTASRRRQEAALRNLDAILAAAGASLATLVKTTIFYQNVGDFAAINAVYARYMPEPPPARSAPANVNLPRGLLISIDAIAVLPAA